MKIRVSEIFSSFQGEGRFTGRPSLWIRFFGCNLKCDGFGQKDPTDPSTYVLPYKTIDIESYVKLAKKINDLPVFPLGCDSSYSWDPKYKSLATDYTETEIVDLLFELGKKAFNVNLTNNSGTGLNNSWHHPITGNAVQLCFTGGEPMLHQKAMNAICEKLNERHAAPPQITIETNATLRLNNFNVRFQTQHLHFSCSPKLFSVSGEKHAVNYEVLDEYYSEADSGAIKFVCNGSQRTWDEIDEIMTHLGFINRNDPWSFWIMPVGSTLESQDPDYLGTIAVESMKRGFNVCNRTHISVFGNKIGT